jgi:hypothetical protein
MDVNTWWLLSVVLLCAAWLVVRWYAKFRARWQRARNLAQAEEANRLCQEYCNLLLRLKTDPFNVSLCQRFLACAPAYHRGDGGRRITAEVEQSIINDLLLAGVRRSTMFEKAPELQVSHLGSVHSIG